MTTVGCCGPAFEGLAVQLGLWVCRIPEEPEKSLPRNLEERGRWGGGHGGLQGRRQLLSRPSPWPHCAPLGTHSYPVSQPSPSSDMISLLSRLRPQRRGYCFLPLRRTWSLTRHFPPVRAAEAPHSDRDGELSLPHAPQPLTQHPHPLPQFIP